MSLVPEIIAAVHCGMKTMGISAITDVVREGPVVPLTHAAVMRVADEIRPRFIRLVRAILAELALEHET